MRTEDTDLSKLNYIAPVFRVADLPRSLSYYRDKLGFEIEFNYADFYVGVFRDGCHIHLKKSDEPPRAAAFDPEEHIDACLGVHDAEALASQLAEAGARFSVPLRSMEYGKEFYVADPDGYILGFVESLDR